MLTHFITFRSYSSQALPIPNLLKDAIVLEFAIELITPYLDTLDQLIFINCIDKQACQQWGRYKSTLLVSSKLLLGGRIFSFIVYLYTSHNKPTPHRHPAYEAGKRLSI